MKKECWLFLDCQEMTGYPPKKCPNYKNCKHNALNNINRVCVLPYHRFFESKALSFLEVCVYVQPEAIAAGWHSPVRIPYRYKPGYLEVGMFIGDLIPCLEKEQIAAGYAIAEELPYIILKNKKLLVKHFRSQAKKEAGWCASVNLPYCCKRKPKRWEVDFDQADERYREAIAAGWYPAESILGLEIPW